MGNASDPGAYLNSCDRTTGYGFITLSSLSLLLMEREGKKGEDRVRDAGDGLKGGRAQT